MQNSQFGQDQARHPILVNLWKSVVEINGVPVEGKNKGTGDYCVVKKDLLYRVTHIGENEVEQLLVPKPHGLVVLRLTHSHLFGAHLGIEKNTHGILKRFVWIGIYKEIETFCKSCPECQYKQPPE